MTNLTHTSSKAFETDRKISTDRADSIQDANALLDDFEALLEAAERIAKFSRPLDGNAEPAGATG